MGGEMGFAKYRSNCAVEDIHKSAGVLLVGITTHRWFIHGDLCASSFNLRFEFGTHNGNQRFRNSVTVWVAWIGIQPPTECVWTRNTGFKRQALRRKPAQPLIFLHDTQAAWSSEFIHNVVLATLIMGRRAEDAERA